MTHSLFCRTYDKDLPWLHELFRSIDKFENGFNEIVVQCDTKDRKAVEQVVANRAIVRHRAPYHELGYRSQQGAKLSADLFCSGEFITFIDSDCVFTQPTTPMSFFHDGKPTLLYTPYDKVGDAICWKASTEHVVRVPAEYEFMRRHGLTYPRETFEMFRRHVQKHHGVQDAVAFCMGVNQISEFNVLGSFCWNFQREAFSWFNTENNDYPPSPIHQFWSYGSITPEVRSKIEVILA